MTPFEQAQADARRAAGIPDGLPLDSITVDQKEAYIRHLSAWVLANPELNTPERIATAKNTVDSEFGDAPTYGVGSMAKDFFTEAAAKGTEIVENNLALPAFIARNITLIAVLGAVGVGIVLLKRK